MIALYAYARQTVAVMGLGRSGLATARALMAAGARVQAWDDNPDLRAMATAEGIPVVNLADLSAPRGDWGRMAAVVWSPGIPHTLPKPHPVARIARDRGVPLVCDIDLLARARQDSFFLGVTGTNGKSTTTALIGHILDSRHYPVGVGGNLGPAALSLPSLPFHGTYVLELSSYQLELSSALDCDIAVLLNISPDHLDRHGDLEGYVAAKCRIFAGGCRPRTAIIGVDDPHGRAIARRLVERCHCRVIPVSGTEVPKGGVGVDRDQLVDATQARPRPLAALSEFPALPGDHNAQNAAAAYAACRARGMDARQILPALRSFSGLPHRQERIASLRDVTFINDSKATNADATAKALACYDTVYWIAGGRAKEGGITSLAPWFDRIRHAFLIGECASTFEATLRGQVPTHRCGELAKAVKRAAETAWRDGEPGAVVLLSPAAASWDQFTGFEQRGDQFRQLVQALSSSAPATAAKGGRR